MPRIMLEEIDNLFEIEEHRTEFIEIVNILKDHPFESPWRTGFQNKDSSMTEVKELSVSKELEETLSNTRNGINKCVDTSLNFRELDFKSNMDLSESIHVQMTELHRVLLAVENNQEVEKLKVIEVLDLMSSAQVLQLKELLEGCLSNNTAMMSFLKSIINLEKPLSLSVASAVVQHIIYPQVFENKQNSRGLFSAVLSYCEMYPKSVIDEIVIPCLRKVHLEVLQMETLAKMSKNTIPDEYVSYAFKNVLEATVSENFFSILQILAERKVHLENSMHEMLALKLESLAKSYCKDLKFIKLLISILTVFGSELNEQLINVYSNIVKENKTIMKRAAENILKKL